MKTVVIKRPKLIAIIKSSGIKSPVEWIDRERKRCRTQLGFEGDLDLFEFVDSRDYGELRGEYAGRAMQSFINVTSRMDGEELEEYIKKWKCDSLNGFVARIAVSFADSLIEELKRPKDYKELFEL